MKEKFRNTVKMYKYNDITISDFEIEYAKKLGLNQIEIDSIIYEIYNEHIKPRKTDIEIIECTEEDIIGCELELEWIQLFNINDYIKIDGDNAYVFHYPIYGDGWIKTTDPNIKELTLEEWSEQNPNINIIDMRDGREYKHS